MLLPGNEPVVSMYVGRVSACVYMRQAEASVWLLLAALEELVLAGTYVNGGDLT